MQEGKFPIHLGGEFTYNNRLSILFFLLFLIFPLIQRHNPSQSFLLPLILWLSILLINFFSIKYIFIFLLPIFYFFFVHTLPKLGEFHLGAIFSFPFYWFMSFVLFVKIRSIPKVLMLVIFISIFFFTLMFVINFNGSLISIAKILNKYVYLFQIIPLFYIGYYLGSRYHPDKVLLQFILPIVSFLSLSFIITHLLGWEFTYSKSSNVFWWRLSGFEKNPNYISFFLAPFVALFFSILIKTSKKISIKFNFLSLSIIFAFIMTDSRSNVLGVIIFLLIFVLFNFKNFLNFLKRCKLLVIIFFIFIFLSQSHFTKNYRTFSYGIKLLQGSAIIDERFIIWPQYIKYFFMKPFFGYGINYTFQVPGVVKTVSYIDSSYIENLLRYGLIGSLLLYLQYIFIFYVLKKLKKTDCTFSKYFISATLIIYFVFSIFSYADNLPPLQISYILLGMCWRIRKQHVINIC